MQDLYYDIKDFNWDGKSNTFYGKENELYTFTKIHNKILDCIGFPSHGKSFYIYNKDTEDARRFILYKDKPLCWVYVHDSTSYSTCGPNDKFTCIVYKSVSDFHKDKIDVK